jgi:nicotinamidase-related amidase
MSNRADNMLKADNAALVLVDVQGKLAQLMADREALFGNLQRMVKGALALELPILWVEQLPGKLGPTIPELADLLPDHRPIAKSSFSCARSDAFNAALSQSGRKQLLLVGMEAHICVYQSAVDLVGAGYQVEVVADAIGSRSAGNREVGLRKMLANGVALTSTEMALFELMGDAGHPGFRDIQALVR